jgi:hypothetical protein
MAEIGLGEEPPGTAVRPSATGRRGAGERCCSDSGGGAEAISPTLSRENGKAENGEKARAGVSDQSNRPFTCQVEVAEPSPLNTRVPATPLQNYDFSPAH